MTRPEPVPVVIAGAGSTGATMALLLARRGIPTVIVDRRADELTHPAAHVLHGRSLEIWREASPALAEQIAALGPPIEDVNLIRWCSEPGGVPLGEIDLASRPEQLARVRSHSDFLVSHVGQHQLMPLLWAALDREPLVDFRRATTVDSLDGHDDTNGPVTVVMSTGDRVDARYVVAADGANSALRRAASIDMVGPVLARMGSVFFRAPGLHPAGARPLLSWIYQPGFAGVLIAHADDHYVLMNTYLHPGQDVAREREKFWARTLPAVLGECDVEIVSTGTWTMTSQTAQVFRRGRVLLAGDAAHRFPHTGGYGLNSGVQDAHNLAWKLDAVLDGSAHERLLDTYDTERRPVIDRFARHSVANHFRLDTVTRHFGVTNRMLQRATIAMARRPLSALPPGLAVPLAEKLTGAGLARTRVLSAPGRRGQRVRDLVAGAIPAQLAHFVSTGLEFGYRYGGPLVATEPDDGRSDGDVDDVDDVVEYRPTTRPGSRLPHALVDGPDGPVSTLQLVDPGPTTLTLFTAHPVGWTGALDSMDPSALGPLTVHVVGLGSDPRVVELVEVGTGGAVVTRADGHVIWRTGLEAVEAADSLVGFLRRSWWPFIGAAVAQPDSLPNTR